MRLSPLVLVFGLAASSMAVPGVSQRPDDQLAPKSVALVKQGEASAAAGKYLEADDAFETALAVDPRNRAAFNGLARVAIRQKLFGSAIRYTTKALSLEPTDREALLVQGEAMVELGALPRARDNLARLQKLCGSCGEGGQLSALIARGPSVAAATKTSVTPAVTKKN